MSKIYSSIFPIKVSGLSSLKEIFSRNYKDILPHVKKDERQVERLTEAEKYFVFNWKSVDDVQEIDFPYLTEVNSKIDSTLESSSINTTIKFQMATAYIEFTKRKRKDEHGNFLPKEERLNSKDVEVLFFEREKDVFALVLSSNEQHIRRTKLLIGEENIANNNPKYLLNPDIFSWLIYMYTERNGELSDELSLENISGFVGNVTDDANIFTGSSNQTTELIVTKAFISNGGELKKITIRVSDGDADITCMINEKSTVVLNCNLSSKIRILDSLDKPIFLLLYLYGYLIIKIKLLYKLEAEKFLSEESPKFSKKIGIEVVKAIIEKNGIELADIDDSFPEMLSPAEIG